MLSKNWNSLYKFNESFFVWTIKRSFLPQKISSLKKIWEINTGRSFFYGRNLLSLIWLISLFVSSTFFKGISFFVTQLSQKCPVYRQPDNICKNETNYGFFEYHVGFGFTVGWGRGSIRNVFKFNDDDVFWF